MVSLFSSLFSLFGPLILSGIESWLTNKQASAQAMANFYQFAQTMQNMGVKWVSNAQQLSSQDPAKDPQPPAS